MDFPINFNAANFVHWFKTQLLPNLTEPSLIRLDNARYHCTKPASAPKVGKAKKAEIQHVLTILGTCVCSLVQRILYRLLD